MKYPMVSTKLFVLVLVVALAWLGVSGIWTSAGAQDLEAVPIQLETAHGGVPGPIDGPAAQAMYGPLPDDPIEVARRKALADQRYGLPLHREPRRRLLQAWRSRPLSF